MIEQKDLGFEQAVLIGIINKNQTANRLDEYLNELAFLTHTAGGTVSKRFTQRMETPHPKTFIGSGKMEEIKKKEEDNEDIKTRKSENDIRQEQTKKMRKP